ncbi:MAG: ribonuclease HII [Ignavibacteriae bacterium]|nr:ribonuclease HII [Ignavibacteriota bacterium]
MIKQNSKSKYDYWINRNLFRCSVSFVNPLKKFDLDYIKDSSKLLAGVDEAGRGPLAGPVVAAAVVFKNSIDIPLVDDSKKIKESDREILYERIINESISFGIGIVDNNDIDEINILQASLKAMKIAVYNLDVEPDIILIDGNKSFVMNKEIHTVVKGDSKSFSIAAASIIAKVERDRIMKNLSLQYPEYKWEKNKGYPTKEHFELVRKYGITPFHRKTFLKKFLSEEIQESLL